MEFKTGDSLGRYRIEALLGVGGMGSVYRAHDPRLERLVAIKVLAPTSRVASGVDELLREARSASALNHPNVCTIYEVGEEGDCAFIAMEYVDGQALDTLLSKGRLPISSAGDYTNQIADALSHAHEQGIIHGDLKTANILISSKNRIKIADFGLARRLEGAAALSSVTTAVIAGTPHAMAPEQLRGGRPDRQTDVWSLGVVFFEMLTGTPPFTGTTLAELASTILRDPTPALPNTVPAALRQVVERCLTKEPAARFRSAREVRASLETVLKAIRPPLGQDEAQIPAQWSVPLPPAFANTGSTPVQLVGRETDLGVLNAATDRARAGRRQFVFVSGEAGIGKTRLLSEFARLTDGKGTVVLLGRCDAEALIPYQPFVEALDWYIRSCPAPVVQAQLEEVESAAELAELIPAVSKRVSALTRIPESNTEGRRYRLFEATASFLAAVSRSRPLLIVLEDLHWADRPTLLMLRHILRSSHEGAVLLVATYRETELDRTHPLGDLLAELRREPSASLLKLQPLNEAEIAKFVAEWVGQNATTPLIKLLASNTEGNPLFMSEVLRHLGETGKLQELQSGIGRGSRDIGLPEGIREVITKRVSRLSDDCKRVLGIASVVGRDFRFGVIQVVAELSEDRLLDVVDEAQAARLIHEAPGTTDGYTFTHALIREALYDGLTAARRVRLHRKIAGALEQLMKPGQEPLADLAYHYGQAASGGDVEKAVTFAVRAGEAAAQRFAAEEASRFYGMALEALKLLPDDERVRERRFELHFKNGKTSVSIGLWAPARAQFEAALPLLLPEQRARKAELLVELAHAAHWLLDVPALRSYAHEACVIAEDIGRDDLWADAMACVAAAENADGNVDKAVEIDRRAIERAGGIRTMTMARSAISVYHAGLTEEAVLRSSESLDAARRAGEPGFIVYALSHLGLASVAAGRYAEAQRAYDEARTVGRQYGVLSFLARAIAMSGGMHMVLGDLSTAETRAHEARELAHQVAFPPALISAGLDLVFVNTRRGEISRAESLLGSVESAVRSAKGWHGWLWQIRLVQVLAELALARGDWRGAVEHASQTITQAHARHRVKYETLGLVTRAQARMKLNERTAALEDISAALNLARKLHDPIVLIDALSANLQIEGNDALLGEARKSVEGVVQALDDQRLRQRFLETPAVRTIKEL